MLCDYCRVFVLWCAVCRWHNACIAGVFPCRLQNNKRCRHSFCCNYYRCPGVTNLLHWPMLHFHSDDIDVIIVSISIPTIVLISIYTSISSIIVIHTTDITKAVVLSATIR